MFQFFQYETGLIHKRVDVDRNRHGKLFVIDRKSMAVLMVQRRLTFCMVICSNRFVLWLLYNNVDARRVSMWFNSGGYLLCPNTPMEKVKWLRMRSTCGWINRTVSYPSLYFQLIENVEIEQNPWMEHIRSRDGTFQLKNCVIENCARSFPCLWSSVVSWSTYYRQRSQLFASNKAQIK